jgi:basic amino acid/polyamine antiporter, APA family
MVGAGVFFVWSPAVSLAGSWVFLALCIAGVIAVLNALSVAQLSLSYPVAGGVYSFARRYVSRRAGFLAGWLFLAGKTSSAAAIALIASWYFSPTYAPWIAAGAVIALVGVNIAGIRWTAALSAVVAVVVVGVLIAVSMSALSEGSASRADFSGSPEGVLPAAGLLFFAFAGYARMATLGEEVKNPSRVLPRVIIFTLLGVLALYALVASAVVFGGGQAVVQSVTPVAGIAPASWSWIVMVAVALASVGSLATVLAGLSRVSLAMAREGDMPSPIATVWSKTSSPALAEITVGALAIVLVFSLDPVWLVGASSGSVLLYYALAHWSAWSQPIHERTLWRVIPVLGLAGCVLLVATLPLASLATTAVVVGSGLLFWEIRRGVSPEAS